MKSQKIKMNKSAPKSMYYFMYHSIYNTYSTVIKTLLLCLSLAPLFILTFSCKSTKQAPQTVEPEIIESPLPALPTLKKYDSMFWEIDGSDKNGEKSKVYIAGTYHLSDERSFPLSEEIENAWNESDRFVCELSEADWDVFQAAVDKKVNESIILGTDKSLVDELSPNELMIVSTLLGEEQTASLICYEPWVLNSILSTLIMSLTGLDFTKSYDYYFIQKAKSEGKSFEGLDSLETQVNLNSYGDWETQLQMLHQTISSFEDLQAAIDEINLFYDAYLSGDAENFEKLYFDDIKKSIEEEPYYEDYIRELLDKRNELWAKKIAGYLEEGGSTFVFAGCAHFIGENSVFNYMFD